MTTFRCTLIAMTFLVTAGVSSGALAYIGEGMQGRPHGGAKAAVRDLYFRHGMCYGRHPRGHRTINRYR